jgi:uncharacterized protein (DUF58 family)
MTLQEPFDASFVARLERLRLVARRVRVSGGHGERTGRRKGGILEFAGHRDYVAGDDLRTVDWNVFGRLEKLCVKEFLRDEQVPVHLLVDRSASMAFGGKDTAALRLAAALACVALAGRNRVVLWGASDGRLSGPRAVAGEGPLLEALKALADLPQGGTAPLSEALRRMSLRMERGAFFVVLSDFLVPDPVDAVLASLSGAGFDGGLVHILALGECNPSHLGNLRLRDAESDLSMDVNLGPEEARRYREAVEAYVSEVRDLARRLGFRHLFSRSDTPVEEMVFDLLAKRGWVRGR